MGLRRDCGRTFSFPWSSKETMRQNDRVRWLVLAGIAGVGLGWWIRPLWETAPSQESPSTTLRPTVAAIASLVTPRLQEGRQDTDLPPIHPQRNLFAFREAQPVRAAIVQVTATTPTPVPKLADPPRNEIAPAAQAPALPAFGYKFLGTFGPAASPFAVFANDGQVENVRAGERIGQSFTLRRIGIETVDVAHVSAPDEVRRIALGQ